MLCWIRIKEWIYKKYHTRRAISITHALNHRAPLKAPKLCEKMAAIRESPFLGSRGSLIALAIQLAQAMLSSSCFLECSDNLTPQDPIWLSSTTIPYRSSFPFKLQGGKDWALTVELFFRISWMVRNAATVLLKMPPAALPAENDSIFNQAWECNHIIN